MLRPRICSRRTFKVAVFSQMFGVKPVEGGEVLRTRVGSGSSDRTLRLSGALDSPLPLSGIITHCEPVLPDDGAVKTIAWSTIEGSFRPPLVAPQYQCTRS
jgi:hypothetical protein